MLVYFILNLFGCQVMPRWIFTQGKYWFNLIEFDCGKYYASYAIYSKDLTLIKLIEVSNKYKYFLYLKTIWQLYRLSDDIKYIGLNISPI